MFRLQAGFREEIRIFGKSPPKIPAVVHSTATAVPTKEKLYSPAFIISMAATNATTASPISTKGPVVDKRPVQEYMP